VGGTRSSSRLAVRVLAGVLMVVMPLVLLEGLLRLTEDGRPWKRAFAEEDAILFERPAAIHDARTASRFTPGWTGRFYFDNDR
jgi:cytochrome b561